MNDLKSLRSNFLFWLTRSEWGAALTGGEINLITRRALQVRRRARV